MTNNENWANSEALLNWLTLAEQTINQNEITIADLSAKEANDKSAEKIANLHKQLINETDEGAKNLLEQEIFRLTQEQESNSEAAAIGKCLRDNELLDQELATIQSVDFLNERKKLAQSDDDENEKMILTELETTLSNKSNLITELRSRLARKKQETRRGSLLVESHHTRMTSSSTDNEIVKEEEIIIPTDPLNLNNSPVDEITIELIKHLTEVDKNWNNHLTGIKKNDLAYSSQEKVMEELMPSFEQILTEENIANIRLLPLTY